MFDRDDFSAMADQLAGLKGQFVMSINDVPEIRTLFGRFELIEVETSYGIASKAGTAKGHKELIVRG